MKITRYEFGAEKNPLVIIDDFLPDAQRAVEIAARIAPFAPERTHAYPGLRHQLTPDEHEGAAYVRAVLQTAAPIINETYCASSLQILAASFSVVTQPPDELEPRQRLPHTDSPDPSFIAVLHHLHHLPRTGTSFYRHRRTGFEKVSEARGPALREAWDQERAEYGEPGSAYFGDSDTRYEKIFEAEARFNRLVIYQGALFHSGTVPPDFKFDPDPRTGRLTGNIFVGVIPA
jgi:hypothetical protein